MEKPYDEKRLGRAVHDILRSLLSAKFTDYYAHLSHTTLREPCSILIPASLEWQYEFIYAFCRGNKLDYTTVIITFDGQRLSAVRVVSDVGSYFEEQAKCQITDKLLYTYYGYFDTDTVVRRIKKLYIPKYALDDISVAYNLDNLQVRRWPKENPTLKQLVGKGPYDKIRSTLKKIVTDTIGKNFDHIIEWCFELEKTPLRASAQYKLCKDEHANMLHVVVIFEDEGLNLEVVSVSAEDDRIREMASCLPHEIRKRFNPLFNEDKKEKKEMDYTTANYIYNVKMTSEMREACDIMIDVEKRQIERKAYYENYKLKARLNAAYGTAALAVRAENKKLAVKEIVINEPAMVVFWEDGTKTVVTAKDEAFDAEKGLAMAFAKKALGNNYAAGGRFKTKLKHAKWAPKKQEKKKDIFCEENIRDDAKEIMEGAKKTTKEKPVTKTAWIKSMMEEGFTRSEATKAWEKKHQK